MSVTGYGMTGYSGVCDRIWNDRIQYCLKPDKKTEEKICMRPAERCLFRGTFYFIMIYSYMWM